MKTHLIFWSASSYIESYCGRRFERIERLVASEDAANCGSCLRTYREVEFSDADHKRALAQGWLLGESTIERDDDSSRFVDDNAAAAYVMGRAEMGCRLARKALRNYRGEERPSFTSDT